jgi:uncharacterized protein YbjQ (UPF0145 family)
MPEKRMRNVGEEILAGIREIKQGETGSISSFPRQEAEREILARLVRGEQEIARGEGYDLDDVLKEADSLLLLP